MKKITAKIKSKEPVSAPIVVEPIDYEKITEAIVWANTQIETAKQEKDTTERQKILAKRKEILKEKDFSDIKCSIWRELRTFLNYLRVVWNLLVISREDAKYFTAVSELTRLLTTLLLYCFGFLLYALAVFFVGRSFSTGVFLGEYIAFAVFFVVFARVIRIARFEVERMENHDYLMNIAMMLIALVTLIATVVGIIVSARLSGGM